MAFLFILHYYKKQLFQHYLLNGFVTSALINNINKTILLIFSVIIKVA